MALAELWSYARGYVIMRVKGGALESFVNAASAQGICLWDVVRLDQRSLAAKVYLRDLPRVGRILRSVGCAGRVERKVGVPFFVRKLVRRRGLAAGAILFSMALYLLSSFVWFVDVRGLVRERPETVREFVAGEGARPGVLRRSVNPNALSRRILAQFPDFAWVGVSVRGTRLMIEIVEKTLPDVARGIADVVAAEDALITNLIVLSGEPLVREGDTVTKGQVLIAGVARGREQAVSAKGIVLGRVWRTYREVVPLVRSVETPTGRVARTRRVVVWKASVRIGPAASPFESYALEERVRVLPFAWARRLPVRIEETTYREVERRVEVARGDEVAAQLREKARAALAGGLPAGARILDEHEDLKYSQDRSLVYVYTIETVEDIGVERREEQGLERTTG